MKGAMNGTRVIPLVCNLNDYFWDIKKNVRIKNQSKALSRLRF